MKLLDVVGGDPRFAVTGNGNSTTLASENVAEAWRRQIHTYLLEQGPLLFKDVGIRVRRPAGFTQQLLIVIGQDPRFVVTGNGSRGSAVSCKRGTPPGHSLRFYGTGLLKAPEGGGFGTEGGGSRVLSENPSMVLRSGVG